MEIGISTFVETTPDVETGEVISHAQRLREVVEEIVLADQVGLDVFGVGEHHRKDYAASSPALVLAAAAPQTRRIRLKAARSRCCHRPTRCASFRILPRSTGFQTDAPKLWRAGGPLSNRSRCSDTI